MSLRGKAGSYPSRFEKRRRQGKWVCSLFSLSNCSRFDLSVSRVADGPFGSTRARALRNHFSASSN